MKKTPKTELISKIEKQETNSSLKTSHVAAYVATMLLGLAKMARESELTVLSYLIDMARLEAENNIE